MNRLYKWLSGDEPPQPDEIQQNGDTELDADSLDWRFYTHKPLNHSEAKEKLREGQRSPRTEVSGFQSLKTHIVQVASLEPVEDRYSYCPIKVEGCDLWYSWGLFDGHSGWATADLLSKFQPRYVSRELSKLGASGLKDASHVRAAIEAAFTSLDNEILDEALKAIDGSLPHGEAMCRIAPASSGSCATMAILDPKSSVVHVACVGDSRAVLGRKTGNEQNWIAQPLSIDQTGFNPNEVARIQEEHPGESPIDIDEGRVLNCAVTRSFGDNRWKWPLKDLETWRDLYFGRNPLSNYHTPPYLTAQPVVETATVSPGDFLIIASDGFWNHIKSNEDAVHLVSMWLQSNSDPRSSEQQSGEGDNQFSKTPQDTTSGNPQKTTGYPYEFIVERSDFLVEDSENVATHLARNAFGGRNQDLFCSLMSTKAPDSKEARDDLTVMVVLF